jgi:hypothetical protein
MMFDNMELRRIFGPKIEDITGYQTKFHTEGAS